MPTGSAVNRERAGGKLFSGEDSTKGSSQRLALRALQTKVSPYVQWVCDPSPAPVLRAAHGEYRASHSSCRGSLRDIRSLTKLSVRTCCVLGTGVGRGQAQEEADVCLTP